MKLSAYIVRYDIGFAPNPFGRYCTLACCKPEIRRKAAPGDIVVGTGSAASGLSGHLVYAMRVERSISYQKYWESPEFAYKKPSPTSAISRRGDNIWHRDAQDNWQVAPGACHGLGHRDSDIGGKCVLISTEFFYLGREAIKIPPEFSDIPPKGKKHHNTTDVDKIEKFWRWISGKCEKFGMHGDPYDLTDAGCKAQCEEVDEEAQEKVPLNPGVRADC